ncbi:hypothetical protein L596_028641 [Steinernema carpocapsae]|uniref:Uncharacterized protein n=1 Tax=Steinernema carpocapsae TaxID=34508 RepID=A0A4V5ZXX9_STECR|nr:hypothetical protein L596_028641 [Steinernema carpocapsae]
MLGISEFLRDYSKDPKYRLAWQVASRRAETRLNLEATEKEDVNFAAVDVADLTKNISDLVSGRDLRGVVAERVDQEDVFRVSAELSSRLYLGIIYVISKQVDNFSTRAYNLYWESRSLSRENFEILGHQRKVALMASANKDPAFRSVLILKIEKVLSDDEGGASDAESSDDEAKVDDSKVDEDLAEVLQRAAKLAETPRRQSTRKSLRQKLLDTSQIVEDDGKTKNASPGSNQLSSPKFMDPEPVTSQVNQGQNLMQMVLDRVDIDERVDAAEVKRRRRLNRNKKDEEMEVQENVDFPPPEADLLPCLSSVRGSKDQVALMGDIPDINPIDLAISAMDQASREAGDLNVEGGEQIVIEDIEAPVKRRKKRQTKITMFMTSPAYAGLLEDPNISAFSEEIQPKRRRKSRRVNSLNESELSVGSRNNREIDLRSRNPLNGSDPIEVARERGLRLSPVSEIFGNSNLLQSLGASALQRYSEELPGCETVVFRDFSRTNGETTFASIVESCVNRHSAMDKFMGLMRLARAKVLEVRQKSYMGAINIGAGAQIETMEHRLS